MELKSPPPTLALGAKVQVDLRLSRLDDGGKLPWRSHGAPALPDDEILARARESADLSGAFVLGGGDPLDPTAHGLELVAALARLRPQHLGVATPGYALTPPLAQALRTAGLRRLVVPFHAARQDAHDWLVATPGGLKATTRAIRVAVQADLPVTAEIVVTRPTLRLLPETVEVLTRLGVRTICVRRLREFDVDPVSFVPMSARIATLEQPLEAAAEVALRGRARLVLRDFPLCAAPRLRPLFASPTSEIWLPAAGARRAREDLTIGCPDCPGRPHCGGAPLDYTRRFGWEEFSPKTDSPVRPDVGSRLTAPLVLSWPGPSRLACDICDGGDRQEESTRAVRAALVRAARLQPPVLRLVGSGLLARPDAAALLYDAVRLFEHVEVAAPAGSVEQWTDLEFRRLKDLRRIDFPLFGPDEASHDNHCGTEGAFASLQRAVARVREASDIQVGTYAVLHDANAVTAFAQAWEEGLLPGPPRFRLSPQGASLDDLAHAALALAPGPVRDSLCDVLPRCLTAAAMEGSSPPLRSHPMASVGLRAGRLVPYEACGTDLFGCFDACDADGVGCDLPECIGTAVGWQRTARTKTWVASI